MSTPQEKTPRQYTGELVEYHSLLEAYFYKMQVRQRMIRLGLQAQLSALQTGRLLPVPDLPEIPEEPQRPSRLHQFRETGPIWQVQTDY